MNLFNSFQAVAFYTVIPFGLQYLFSHGLDVWGYILSVIMFIGYCLISCAVHEAGK